MAIVDRRPLFMLFAMLVCAVLIATQLDGCPIGDPEQRDANERFDKYNRGEPTE